MPEPIAIVGLGGVLPGVSTLDDFWSIVEAGVDTASDPPPGRWCLDINRAYSTNQAQSDRVHSRRACFIRDFEPDFEGIDLPSELIESLDPMVHLALHAGQQAWRDSMTDSVDPARVGVMLGNIVLPTASVSALADWILGRRFERELFRAAGMPMPPETRTPVAAINRWVAGLPATLLARGLRLGGDRFCIDAACASSLFTVELAVDALRRRRLDAVLAGGLSRPDSLYTQMGFSQLLAVSPTGRCSPFDHKCDGLVVGEGAGILVLKRLSDARQQGDRVRAVIHSVGLSNDVEGSLLAPSREGQLRAMRGAYQAAGWTPGQVDLVECHATGTPVGDSVEFASLRALWIEEKNRPGQCVIGSVKSNTGHLLTGAGAVGLLKTVLAMESQVLPPTANFEKPGDKINLDGSPFRVLVGAEPWKSPLGHPRRAAVSGFGFGGTNAHVLLEEPTEPTKGRSAVGVTLKPHSTQAHGTNVGSVAIVGLGARVGPWKNLVEVGDRLMGRGKDHPPHAKENHWGIPDAPAGWFIEHLEIPIGRFKIPPREVEGALPQQMLMLQIAEHAIADADLSQVDRLRTGVFIGVELDLNTTNYHLRWAVTSRAVGWAKRLGRSSHGPEFDQWVDELCDSLTPALNANRTIGGLGSITASRIAREFGLGGPSYVMSSEETSGLSALYAASRALQQGRIDCAVVGAVDLTGDVRSLISLESAGGLANPNDFGPFGEYSEGVFPSDGAVALVLKRTPDAERDGDRMYAIVRAIGTAGGDPNSLDFGSPASDSPSAGSSIEEAIRRSCDDADVAARDLPYVTVHRSGIGGRDRAEMTTLSKVFGPDTVLGCAKVHVGHTGAAAGLVSVLDATLSLYRQVLPAAPGSRSCGLTSLCEPTPWVRDRVDGPRRTGLLVVSRGASCCHVILEEAGTTPSPQATLGGDPSLSEGLFVVEGDDSSEIVADLRILAEAATAIVGPHHADAGRPPETDTTELPPIGSDEPALIHRLARDWWEGHPNRPDARLAVTLIARDSGELRSLVQSAADQLEQGDDPAERSADRLFFSRDPLGPKGELAFVYPGSGNQYAGMGRNLCLQWPEILRAQDRSNERLKSQLKTAEIWGSGSDIGDAKTVILSQVTLGTIATDLITGFGVRPQAVVGYSLGETTGLFSLGAWHERDNMLRRVMESELFDSDLTGRCNAARKTWEVEDDTKVEWSVGMVEMPAARVREVMEELDRVYLLIVNTPDECVIGGDRSVVQTAVEMLGCSFHSLEGVTTVHCEVAAAVAEEYRNLHVLDTRPPEDIRFYSGAWGKAYEVDQDRAADSLLAQAIHGVDFPKTVRQAHDDGVRIFLEMGPGGSCTRMIQKILDGLPFRARSLFSSTQDEASAVLRALGMLISERISVDLTQLYSQPKLSDDESGPVTRISVGQAGFGRFPLVPQSEASLGAADDSHRPLTASPQAPLPWGSDVTPNIVPEGVSAELIEAVKAADTTIQAHEAFLRASQLTRELAHAEYARQQELVRALTEHGTAATVDGPPIPADLAVGVKTTTPAGTLTMDRNQLMEFAIGSISRALGERFAYVDAHPTRVRLPGEPLMLVDRVTKIDAQPQAMTSGRIVTEHDVLTDGWYLDGGRLPTCIAVEAGQADLLLSGFLGIDSKTQGLAVYRLLDAVVTFYSELPTPEQVVQYDIRILGFFRQGNTWLFRFQFDSTVDGRPLLTMREGTAGFFTQSELDAGKGIVRSDIDQQEQTGIRPADWRDLVPMRKDALGEDRLEALRAGDLVGAFGEDFRELRITRPLTIPGGRMRLIHRITEVDPEGGRYGIGSIVAEADIHPDDWFLTCHFSDDQVMPGTLMYECCLHTLRVFLLRMGWIADADGAAWQPVVDVKSKLRCRGQVLASTKKVTYEIHLRELGYQPEPYAIADALMYADRKSIVEIRDMSVRLTGTDQKKLDEMWLHRSPGREATPNSYDKNSVLAFSSGKPSEAFGAPYGIFDEGERHIARLPRPPYQFLDRISAVGGEPFVMQAGATVTTHFDVHPNHWYFGSNRQREIPFAVLLEVGLQPCGWLAAYVGSALTSEDNLRFRNLGGEATQLVRLTASEDVITTRVELTSVSASGGMIIQHYTLALDSERLGPLYGGTTYFGFFSEQALADQVGILDAPIHEPTATERARGRSLVVPSTSPFPEQRFRMVDQIDLLVPDGGADGLGWVHGSIKVDPNAWFFEAHFYQDPVWPGSLGLEALIQLLKVYAVDRWRLGEGTEFTTMASGQTLSGRASGEVPHRWTYRGQIVPGCERVEVFASITHVDDAYRHVRADGFLVVDGRVIYAMNNFTLDVID
ncbi:MAG: beta-ketoacyl synthase N-terminal-like domain-containing protein [Gemmatimonadota bacterium]|nr:beta-ketoacyl synthase N-terminal-like domain-containing protein [Gemmatimonadota bacterium]